MPGEGVVIGVVVSHDHRRWADSLAEELPELLRRHVDPDANWSIEVEEASPADASASPSDLTGAVRRRTLDRGWEMGIGLTGLPLRSTADRSRPTQAARTPSAWSAFRRSDSTSVTGRLLAGMIRANQPTRVMSRLSRSAAAALGTGAYALISTNVWALAHEGGWPRLLAIALLSLAMILFAMVFAHGLWERARDDAARERIVLSSTWSPW
jgi:hypothetical protein